MTNRDKQNENKLFLTVDVECHHLDKRNLYLDGKIGDSYWGLRKILEIGQEKRIPINFFLDVVEGEKYGDHYVMEIVSLIRTYGQKIYFHIHPSFMKRGGKPFFWQYSHDEQKALLLDGFEAYERYVGCKCKAMRMGGYAADNNMYEVLNEIIEDEIVDLSYLFSYAKCHYMAKKINQLHRNGKIMILPNTRYRCFEFLGIKKYANLDIADSNLGEMKRVLKHRGLRYMVCTMHSWNLFKHLLYHPQTLRPDERNVDKMRKFIDYAQCHGWVFSDFEEPLEIGGEDADINLCEGIKGKISGWMHTFFRMQRVARVNIKYLKIYTAFYAALLGLAILSFVFLLV